MRKKQDDEVTILLVDDREDGLIALESVLGDNPLYRLICARSGSEALAQMAKHSAAVILLDVQMPGMDGFETAERIRRNEAWANVPILFVTAINKDERYVHRGYATGAVDYIFKPFDPLILKFKVEAFVKMHLRNLRLERQAQDLAIEEAESRKAFIGRIQAENQRRYRNLADSIPHIVMRALPGGDLEYHNGLWTSFTGMSLSESLGMGWQNALEPQDLPFLLNGWYAAMREGQRFETECRIRRYDGSYRWHWVKGEPECGSDEEIAAWLVTCTDIHDRKAVEHQLQEARRQAESASVAKTHFLANMSHEIRTPLTAILGFAELLLEPESSAEERQKNIAVVRRNGEQLLKLIDEVLDISKVEAGKLVIEKAEVALSELLADVQRFLEAQAHKKGITLKFNASSRLPSVILTDATRLRQILMNIVGNAIKFTNAGSVNVNMSCSPVSHGGAYRLSFRVEDTGVGISSEQAGQLFVPFSQAESSTNRLFGGTGLGLALCRKFAQALDGDVKLVKSAPGVGSVFEVQVQVGLPESCEWAKSTADEIGAIQDSGSPGAFDRLKGKRILLVDDSPDNQVLIQHFLKCTGAIIDLASNGAEGFEKALAGDYELVLMDLQMPVVDGYEATSRLRQSGFKRPIIALTAHALAEERDRCLSLGCTAHLTKPINRVELIETLADQLYQ